VALSGDVSTPKIEELKKDAGLAYLAPQPDAEKAYPAMKGEDDVPQMT
jgi:hypothetical protein